MDPLYDALLGQLAVDAGLLTQDQLAECIRLRESTGRPLGAILLERGYLTDESLEKLLEARAEASYLGLFPLEVRKKRTTEMFLGTPPGPRAGTPPAEAPAAPKPSEQIAEVTPVFPGEGAPAAAETPAAMPPEVEGEFISDTPLPVEAEEGVPVAAFVDASRDVPAPVKPSEMPTDRMTRPPSAAELPDLSQEERSFGLVLERCGLLNERRIEECIDAQNQIRTHGIRLRLGEILVRKGIASPKQVRDILRLQGVTLLHCPECLVNYNVHGYGHGRPASCPRCEGPLVVPVVTAIDAVDTIMLGAHEASPHAPLETFGRYILFEEIGHGQLGITYKAWDTQAGRLVALKRLCPIDAEVGEDLDRITEDAKPAVGLRHPAVAETYEVGDVDGDRYVAAEFIEGTALSRHLRAGDSSIEPPVPLTPRNIADIARQVAGGLGAAHARDVLHHDVRPANILLDPDGKAHLTDFGLAIDRRPSLGDSPTKFSHPIRGTFPYIAPECALEDAPVGPGADVFSLGVVMYEALTGKVPFEGDTPEKVLYSILRTPPDPPSRWALNLPRDLEQIVMKAIARDPGERYPDGTALAVDLHRFVSGEALEEGEIPMEVEPAPQSVEPMPEPAPAREERPPLAERIAARRRGEAAKEPVEAASSGGRGKGLLVLALLVLIGAGVWAYLYPVTNYLKGREAEDHRKAGRWEKALEIYKFLEGRGVADAAAKRKECDGKIAAQKEADARAARLKEAQTLLGNAGAALESARAAFRAAATGGPDAAARAQEGIAKAREAAGAALDAVDKDHGRVEAWVLRAQALWLAGDAAGAQEAAAQVPPENSCRAGVVPTLVSIALRPVLARRGPLTEIVSPTAGVRYARSFPEPTDEEYRKAREALQPLLPQLSEPGKLARPLATGIQALLDGKGKAAAEELAKAVEVASDDGVLREALAIALLGVGDGEGALQQSNAALVLRPADAVAMWARALSLSALGRPDADAAFDQAIAADGKSSARLDRIAARLASGKPDAALGEAMQAVAERPDDARAQLLLSRSHLAMGDPMAALADVEKALAANANLHAARVLHGDLLLQAGRVEDAVQELKRCVSAAPDDLEAALDLAQALVAEKDIQGAMPFLDRVLTAAHDWPEALGVRAEAKLAAKDWDGAIADANAALAKDARQAAAIRVRALARLAKGEEASAEQDLSQAIEKFPKDVELIASRARIRMKTGQAKAAIYDLTVALGIAPKDASLLLARARAYRLTGAPDLALKDLDAAQEGASGKVRLDVLLERARIKEDAGDIEGALADATAAVKEAGDSPEAHALRARVLVAAHQAADATQDANEALMLSPGSAEAYAARATVHEALGHFEEAKKDVEEAIRIDPAEERYYPLRARLRRRLGDTTGAAEDEARAAKAFRPQAQQLLEEAHKKADANDLPGATALADRAIGIDPGNVAAWRDRGFYRKKANDAQGALSDLDRAHELDPKNADILSQRASVKRALKDLQGAVDDWTACLDIDAGRSEDRVARASAWRSLGQKDKALEEVNQALSEKPDSVEGRRLRATLRNSTRDYAGAVEDATRAIDAGGADAWTFFQRAYACDALGKLQEAVDDFTRAVQAKEDYGDAYSHRGWVYLEMGNAASARNDEMEAIKINAGNAWAHFRLAAVYAGESAKGAQSPIASDGDLAAAAVAELGKAIDAGFASKAFLDGTHYFDAIRNDPRFQDLAGKLK